MSRPTNRQLIALFQDVGSKAKAAPPPPPRPLTRRLLWSSLGLCVVIALAEVATLGPPPRPAAPLPAQTHVVTGLVSHMHVKGMPQPATDLPKVIIPETGPGTTTQPKPAPSAQGLCPAPNGLRRPCGDAPSMEPPTASTPHPATDTAAAGSADCWDGKGGLDTRAGRPLCPELVAAVEKAQTAFCDMSLGLIKTGFDLAGGAQELGYGRTTCRIIAYRESLMIVFTSETPVFDVPPARKAWATMVAIVAGKTIRDLGGMLIGIDHVGLTDSKQVRAGRVAPLPASYAEQLQAAVHDGKRAFADAAEDLDKRLQLR